MPSHRSITAMRVTIVYLLIYFFASYLDLSTTVLALRGAGTHEGDVFTINEQSYDLIRAWAITLAAALVMAGCVTFAVRYASRVEEVWLRHPVRSFGLFYFNPWSGTVIGRSAIHMLSVAIAFAALRVLAAANNLLIHYCGIAPIGAPIGWIAKRSSPLLGFLAVIIPLFLWDDDRVCAPVGQPY